MLDKNKLIQTIESRMKYMKSNNSEAEVKELKDLLYVINKGCFDYKQGSDSIAQ